MPQLLLEFFSEEIPARMQKRAEEDLARALGEKLKGAGLEPKAIKTFSSPRRIGATIDDLPAKAADVNEEKKGPRVGAPDQAIQGFLKSAGLKDIGEAQVVEDKKGAFYVARIERAGRETGAILQEIVPEIVRGFPWPKSMRSGESDLQWVRPLQNILCIFGGAHVKISVDNVPSEAKTWGHRFHAPGAITPKDFADYAEKLRAAKVEIDREARKAKILGDARRACAGKGLELVEDVGLLEEVCGLVEWPVVLIGDMDPAFLDLPGEVIRLSMRTHQKYFAVRDPKTQKLAPHFITVANVEAKDGGKAIAAGNARVLSARLNDARFFWETDKKTPLDTPERRAKLEKIVFHQKLGSVWDKVERVKALARELAPVVWASLEARHSGASRSDEPGIQEQSAISPWVPDRASRVRNDALLAGFIAAVERAAELCKMDLVTETVGEFPELQGQVGRQLYLAELNAPSPQGGGESVAQAIEDHYRPLGPNDRVPSDPVAVTLALADKLDMLVGFWAIDEKPTGSSDPYALRRAALGVIRVLLVNGLRLSLDHVNDAQGLRHVIGRTADQTKLEAILAAVVAHGVCSAETRKIVEHMTQSPPDWLNLVAKHDPAISDSLLDFLHDRLKVHLREQGARHDLIDAALSMPGRCDIVLVVKRVEALDAFLQTEDGANLLAGSKRAANILAAEEKKGKWSAEEAGAEVDASKLVEPGEKALHAALEKALPAARAAVEKEDFAAAMKALAGLRAPVDAFFEAVLVNAPEEQLRRNRLLLLTRFKEALSAVADFSRIEG
ncbi:MAG: glycine--tRNA ligase subunit beta [Hyphomonadaceae bacterium]|nr:glycine--tRNA ligase subunit beta [Hyphomonadaceae bacterium]